MDEEKPKLTTEQLVYYMIGRMQGFEDRMVRLENLMIQILNQNAETKADVGKAKESIGFFYWVYKFLRWPAAITATATLATGAITLIRGLIHGL